MKIGLINVDSRNFPNLCLMKLSAYHRNRGDSVEWWNPAGRYDIVYKSKVFTDTYSKDAYDVRNADQIITGGTGYGLTNYLPDEVEHIMPDYSLYPQFSGTAYSHQPSTAGRTSRAYPSSHRKGSHRRKCFPRYRRIVRRGVQSISFTTHKRKCYHLNVGETHRLPKGALMYHKPWLCEPGDCRHDGILPYPTKGR